MHTVKDYQIVIQSIELLTMKMDAINQEFFEANVDFISKLSGSEIKEELFAKSNLSSYDTKFKGLLKELEEDTRRLKREKINYQFKTNLMTESVPLV